jgi:ankyrin repeat protein
LTDRLLEMIENDVPIGRLDPNHRNPNTGCTPLHVVAALRGSRAAKVAQLLVDSGSDLEARCDEGRTPLSYAVVANSVEVAEVLLASGCSVHRMDVLVAGKMGHVEMERLLRRR